MSRWLRPYLCQGVRTLERTGEQDICHDDHTWLKIVQTVLRMPCEALTEILGEALSSASIRAFHGCRVGDAGVYFREGILRNDPAVLAARLRMLLDEEESLAYHRSKVEELLADQELFERDKGRVYLTADDKGLVESAGHYLLYGGEWFMCMLGFPGHEALRKRGVPTMLQLDLPLSAATTHERTQLAKVLLQEWARIKVNRPDWVPDLDFTFTLHQDVPAEWLIGHYHPTEIADVHHQYVKRRTPDPSCPHCQEGNP
ncbi:hypothetical protein LJR009_005499 [Bosea sp. LjRoot9]|uniref:hypothetical protein n=1 Tax=Bosea sp. LjRoot9 TaxID=3342341 RepID=UPI003ECF9DED